MIPKMEACLRAVRGGVPQAHVLDGRLPHAVLLEIFTDSGIGTMVAAGRRARRDDVAPMTATGSCRTGTPPRSCRNYGVPPVALARGEGCQVWDADGREYLDLIAGHRGQRARPRPPGASSRRSPGRSASSRTPPTCSCTSPRSRWPSGCSACSARDGRVFLANSGTEANEAALKLVRRAGQRGPARTVIVAAEHGFHGRTDGRARADRQGVHPRAVRAVRARRAVRAVRRRGARWPRRSPATSPRSSSSRAQGEAGVVPPPAGLPARRPGSLRRGRRAAGAGRDPERHRPHRRLVRPPARGRPARRAHAGQGARRRAADRRLHRPRRVRHRAATRATTAARSAATRSPAPRRSPCSTRSRPTACWTTPRRRASGSPPASPAIDHPLLAGVRGRGLWLAVVLTAPVAAAGGGGRPAGRVPGQRGPAGRDPAGAAADPHRRAGRRVRRRAARDPRRRPRAVRRRRPAVPPARREDLPDAPALPARRRPVARPSRPRCSTWPTR